jgi:hypothetical protein
MNLRHIEIFHAVYVNGSVSAAARALNASQPSVSKMLRHAETLLGFQLFQRTSGGLVPTEDAHFSEFLCSPYDSGAGLNEPPNGLAPRAACHLGAGRFLDASRLGDGSDL